MVLSPRNLVRAFLRPEGRRLNIENKQECWKCRKVGGDAEGCREFFRPTRPGHSPGVGHSDQKRIVEPHV
uniref:Uncharacterized protein n=1 Tax=Nelumbo nucifera TaxID=4432 RepID=A0A822Z8N1_NELNU|nr:TPA_asm: hypothetical protein HUJ06_015530 [Nelumbo nucifera]